MGSGTWRQKYRQRKRRISGKEGDGERDGYERQKLRAMAGRRGERGRQRVRRGNSARDRVRTGREVKGGDGERDADRRYPSWGHLPPVLLMQCDHRRSICGGGELLEKA